MAALTAARAGADVILVEEDSRAGGRLLAETHEVDGMPGPQWVGSVLNELIEMPNVRLMERTTVTGVYDQGTYGALERARCTARRAATRRSNASGGSWRSRPCSRAARTSATSPSATTTAPA
jgi:NADPH-dependent 2,4-dienoyl-CoA reductase/sulfur reductase-like enzyme